MNPYLIQGPALISFSGGRTSAFMLRQILDAHGGALPDGVHVAFANTGKEREETLRFVHECGSRWGVQVRWIEWRDTEEGYEEVGFNSASRQGEPFAELIRKRGFVPNQGARYCSVTLKVRAIRNFAVRDLGWGNWTNIIGLRADEGRRVVKAMARNAAKKDRFDAAMPMHRAGHTRDDVLEFWSEQDFDLGLHDHEGNCDLCFLKSRGKIKRLMRDHPGMAEWWKAMEAHAATAARDPSGRVFRQNDSYEGMEREVHTQPLFPGLFEGDDDHDVECGLTCGGGE